MQVGDLVKARCPTTKQVKLKFPTTRNFNKVFLVTEWLNNWIKVLGRDGWQSAKDFEVINESR